MRDLAHLLKQSLNPFPSLSRLTFCVSPLFYKYSPASIFIFITPYAYPRLHSFKLLLIPPPTHSPSYSLLLPLTLLYLLLTPLNMLSVLTPSNVLSVLTPSNMLSVLTPSNV